MKIKKEKIIVVTGEFDPISKEDTEFLKKAKSKGDWLVVGPHSDIYLAKYKGGFFQSYDTRSTILRTIKYVDEVFMFNDLDGTACQLLKIIQISYPNAEIFFISDDGETGMIPESKVKGVKILSVKQI